MTANWKTIRMTRPLTLTIPRPHTENPRAPKGSRSSRLHADCPRERHPKKRPAMHELVFLATGCTGVDVDADIWEFAAVRRHADGAESQLRLFIEHDASKAARLPTSFRTDYLTRCPDGGKLVPQRMAAAMIAEFISDDCVIVGAAPALVSQHLAALFTGHRITPPTSLYTVLDVCALAAGHLQAQGQPVQFPAHAEDMAARLGMDPEDYPRHTALDDVDFVQAIFDRCTAAAWPLRPAPVMAVA